MWYEDLLGALLDFCDLFITMISVRGSQKSRLEPSKFPYKNSTTFSQLLGATEESVRPSDLFEFPKILLLATSSQVNATS
jgi:hypothetical protein